MGSETYREGLGGLQFCKKDRETNDRSVIEVGKFDLLGGL